MEGVKNLPIFEYFMVAIVCSQQTGPVRTTWRSDARAAGRRPRNK